MSYASLSALEAAHDDAIAAARRRMDQVEESIGNYRSQLVRMQETAYGIAASQGIADHPGFQTVFARISHEIDENVRAGGRATAELEEGLDALRAQHFDEREEFLQQRDSRSLGF